MIVVLLSVIVWLAILVGNLIHCHLKQNDNFDNIFKTGTYSYDEVLNRITLIEQHFDEKLPFLRKVIYKYHLNSKATKRKFYYYSKYIEPRIMATLFIEDQGQWNFFWKRSSIVTKLHFYYVLLIPTSLFLFLKIGFNEVEDYVFLMALIPIILFVLGVTAYILLINVFCYNALCWMHKKNGKENGPLNKNTAALEAVSESAKFYKSSALILGAGGAISTSSLGKPGGFKGMGGGDFGGGGSSGAW